MTDTVPGQPHRTVLIDGNRRPKGKGGEPPPEMLYKPREKVHPQSISGRYRSIKWAVLLFALAVYYFLPFLRWSRGPGEPSQAVLIDLDRGRFYFFFIELWPQDISYLMGLLILAAFVLFFMNAIAGRVWCGYLCPQTVWTDLFMAVERFVEGDRRERLRLDAAPWSAEKIRKRVTKHFVWLLVAWWTGGAWVLYFADAPTLVVDLATFNAAMVAYFTIGILTFTTYVLAGLMREQVCTYMCPWPRIQAALTDRHALNVSYRVDRGEPRVSVKHAAQLRAAGAPAGDCIDCRQCVVVCPTGIDIRDGLQLECIQCGLCIDACDAVMDKIDRPRGLIAYQSEDNLERLQEGRAPVLRIVRPRTILYVALIGIVGIGMLYGLLTRSVTGLSSIHDRNPIFVTLADGSLRNGYTLRILNKKAMARRFTIEVEGLPGARIEAVGGTVEDGKPVIAVPPDSAHEARVLVSAPRRSGATPILLRITDRDTGETAVAKDNFRGP